MPAVAAPLVSLWAGLNADAAEHAGAVNMQDWRAKTRDLYYVTAPTELWSCLS
jgi:hypothetical protein